MWLPNSRWTWSFLLVTMVQALISLALEAYVFAKFQGSLIAATSAQENVAGSEVRTIPTYLGLLIFGFIYELLLVYDALSNQNTIQVIGLCTMNLAIMVYTAVQTDQIHDAFTSLSAKGYIKPEYADYWTNVEPLLIALPVIVAVCTVMMAFIAWKLYQEFAWSIYKQISADVRLKRRFLVYQIYIALLKFDFFLFLGFVIQFLIIVKDTTGAEYWLTVAALPMMLVLLFIAAFSTQRENVIGMIITIIFYFVALAYFIFKLVRMYTASGNREEDYRPARRTLTIFAIITILFLLATIVIACWCTKNFGKGLKQHVDRRAAKHGDDGQQGDKMYLNDVGAQYSDAPGAYKANAGSRMEID